MVNKDTSNNNKDMVFEDLLQQLLFPYIMLWHAG